MQCHLTPFIPYRSNQTNDNNRVSALPLTQALLNLQEQQQLHLHHEALIKEVQQQQVSANLF